VDCILALGGDLYLEDAGPELAGHEQPLGLAVIGYPVEDIYWALMERGGDAREVNPAQYLTRGGGNPGNSVSHPNVRKDLSLNILQLVEQCHWPIAIVYMDLANL